MQQLFFCLHLTCLFYGGFSFALPQASSQLIERTLSSRARVTGCTQDEKARLVQAIGFLEILAYNAQEATQFINTNLAENAEFYDQFHQYLLSSISPDERHPFLLHQQLNAHQIASRVYLTALEALYTNPQYPNQLYIHCGDVERRCIEGNHAAAYLMRWQGPDGDQDHIALVR